MERAVLLCILACAGACGRLGFAVEGEAPSDAVGGDVSDAPAPLGSWSLVQSTGDTVMTTADHTVQIIATAGDLLVAACDHQANSTAGEVTMSTSPDVGLTSPYTAFDPLSTYRVEIAWSIVPPSAGTGTAITVTFGGFGTFLGNYYSDCSASVFRGGITAPRVVAMQSNVGGAGGLVTCDPIATVAGGVAFYFAARSNCVDAPTGPPFQKLGATFGNTWGAWAPTDGTAMGTTLTDCGNAGGWLCSMVSLTP